MDSFLGVKAISVATRVTVVLAVIFLLLAIILAQLPHNYSGRGLISSEKAPANTVNTIPVNPPTTAPVGTVPAAPAGTDNTAAPGSTTPPEPPAPPPPPQPPEHPRPLSPTGR